MKKEKSIVKKAKPASLSSFKKPALVVAMALALVATSALLVSSETRDFVLGSFAKTKYVCVKEDKKIPKCTGGGVPFWNQAKCVYTCDKGSVDNGPGTTGNTYELSKCKEGPSKGNIACECSRSFTSLVVSGVYNYEVTKCISLGLYDPAGRYGTRPEPPQQ